MKGHWSGFVWLGLALAFFKWFSIDVAEQESEIQSWEIHEAVIFSSSVTLDSAGNEYELGIEFGIDFGDQKLKYNAFRQTGSKPQLEKLASTSYAKGARISVFINPDNRAEYAFNAAPKRVKWFGYLGTALLAFIGISVLRGPRKSKPTET